ncbi:MAG: hypothetical protein HN919_22810 [Verrucomicrobia bacterium]|jgi:hypothetical protein|nr:hypothetical protein [Verrucomicrobiota bacterium]
MSDYRLGPGETFEDVYEQRSDDYGTARLFHITDQVLREMEPLINELEGLWPIMPKVDEEGYSECPFAEDLHRKKQSLENQVAEKLTTAHSVLRDTDGEIERCKRNLGRISVDAGKLNRPEARSNYTEAWGIQEQEYVEATQEKERVLAVIKKAEATLAASRKKTFPMPLSDDNEPAGLPASASSYPESDAGGSVEQRVDDMFSMGRM